MRIRHSIVTTIVFLWLAFLAIFATNHRASANNVYTAAFLLAVLILNLRIEPAR